MKRALFALLLLAACDRGEPAAAPPSSAPPTSVAAPVPPPPTSSGLDVHEWGLIDVPLTVTQATVSAVPACGTPPLEHDTRPRPPRPIARPRAPLLYFHLAPDHAALAVSLRVSLPGGAITEHWPLTTLTAPDAVSWTATVRPEHCAGSSYPGPNDLPCEHQLCEAMELAAYETADASCVHVGDADFADLFYAGQVPLTIPLRIARDGDAVTITNDDDAPLPGPVYFVTRSDDRSATRAGQAIAQPHAPVTMRAELAIDQLPVAPFDLLRSEHLTSAEVDAFSRAWSCAVFGGTHEDGSPCSTERQPTHFVLFLLPRARVDALAPLVIEPAPDHIERAIMVRVDLDH